jgi:hypothetical protein
MAQLPHTMSVDLSAILNQRFALRKLLSQSQYHSQEASIPKDATDPSKEPHLLAKLHPLAKAIADNPSSILADSYSLEERKNDWKSLVKKIVVEEDTILPIDARSRPGHKILDHHMTHFYQVSNYKGESVEKACTEENLLKALVANLRMHTTPYKSEIRRMLTMTHGLSNVTKYRASTAKAIVQRFHATRVLDPCIGWGGRMLGTLASGPDTQYVGCDPDPNTYQALVNILEDPAIPSSASQRATLFHSPV